MYIFNFIESNNSRSIKIFLLVIDIERSSKFYLNYLHEHFIYLNFAYYNILCMYLILLNLIIVKVLKYFFLL